MQLRILDDIVLAVGTVHQLCRIIARQDPDLGKQLKRAVNSVGLNAGEGLSARGGNRTVRLEPGAHLASLGDAGRFAALAWLERHGQRA